jgi:hypothetical protein
VQGVTVQRKKLAGALYRLLDSESVECKLYASCRAGQCMLQKIFATIHFYVWLLFGCPGASRQLLAHAQLVFWLAQPRALRIWR